MLTNCRLLDTRTGQCSSFGHNLVIRQGRIEAVDSPLPPQGAVVINCSGLVLMPGEPPAQPGSTQRTFGCSHAAAQFPSTAHRLPHTSCSEANQAACSQLEGSARQQLGCGNMGMRLQDMHAVEAAGSS